jgi:UDP-3-O-[3-hydroxymyristoyl] glucosamine N-acyltransferase
MNNKYYARREFKFSEVLHVLVGSYELIGDPEFYNFNNVADIVGCDEGSLAFVTGGVGGVMNRLEGIKSNTLIVQKTGENFSEWDGKKLLLVTDSPRTNFAKIVDYVMDLNDGHISGNQIHSSAIIDSNAVIGKNVFIGPYSIIGKVVIGDGTKIGPHVHIADGTIIGKNVDIQTGCVIGAVAYSKILNEPNSCRVSFPQLAGVVIEDSVSIGPMSCIQRGALIDTVIRKNSSLDTFVQIAHNVEIGRDVTIIGHSHVGGSVKVGDRVYIGQSSTIDNIGKIGSEAFIGIGSVVIRPVESGTKVFGNPATRIINPQKS